MTQSVGNAPASGASPSTVEAAVKERYSKGAQQCEAALCCPVSYDTSLLEVIPAEVIERDYGCGDPTKYVQAGETVLDLGSGSGKACFIISQVVGPSGAVIGADMNDDMLALARGAAPVVAGRIGHDNVRFVKCKIQDLGLDCEQLDRYLAEHPVKNLEDYERVQAFADGLRSTAPAVASDSVDVVVSNCVLNLVRPDDKAQLFGEIFRVLKKGGRAVISDIVADEDIPIALQNDKKLWSGCISGAYREDAFLKAFEEAGFHGIEILERVSDPWQTVEGIEFRSVTVAAYKGKAGPRWDQKHAVIYKGPFAETRDDDGHVFRRGVRTAVCEKTFKLLTSAPYSEHFAAVEPRVLIALADAPPFPCSRDALIRHPRETKGADYKQTTDAGAACGPSKCC